MNLSARLQDEIRALAKKNHVEKVILFGSRARGTNSAVSDIDLAASGGNIAGFSVDVDEETSTLLMFDVANLDGRLAPELRGEIERDGITIYDRQGEQNEKI